MPTIFRRPARGIVVGTLIGAVLCTGPAFARAAASSASPSAAHGPAGPCFFLRNWQGGWKATPNARAIYIRVDGSIYRLDLQSSYSLLKDPFAVLINKSTASTVCGPLGFDLTVSNRAGVEQWPIVKRMTRLTPAQASVLPQKLRP
ncbi:MAG: hypothetical protein ACREUG_15635 [Steroidobacteraceae bacterium]